MKMPASSSAAAESDGVAMSCACSSAMRCRAGEFSASAGFIFTSGRGMRIAIAEKDQDRQIENARYHGPYTYPKPGFRSRRQTSDAHRSRPERARTATAPFLPAPG